MRSLVIEPSFPPAASWQLYIYIVTDDYEEVNHRMIKIHKSKVLYTFVYSFYVCIKNEKPSN